MSYHNLLKFLSVISTIYIVSTALSVEDIIGGTRARSMDFQYLVGICGKQNNSHVMKAIGGGALISQDYVLSAFLNFFTLSYQLKKFKFFIAAGSDNINTPRIIVEIDEIYLPEMYRSTLFYNVVITKLKCSLNFPDMQIISIPIRQETTSLIGQTGIVPGYGLNWVQIGTDFKSGRRIRALGHSDGLLNFLKIDIVDSNSCKGDFVFFNNKFHICGVNVISLSGDSGPAGVCLGDVGSPLVVDNKVVGITSLINLDCNQNTYGAIYTNISQLLNFTNSILRKDFKHVAFVIKNPHHIPPPQPQRP